MTSPTTKAGTQAGDDPLSLERYAEVCAELDAGAPRKELFERQSIAPELWARSQAHWLKRMAAEVEVRRFPLTTRYQAIFTAKRAVAEARSRAERKGRPKPAQPAVGPVEAAAAELAKPASAPLPPLFVPEPPRPAAPAALPSSPVGEAPSLAQARVAPPRFVAPPPPVAPPPSSPSQLDKVGSGRTAIVDIGVLLKKQIMPFPADDDAGRTGIVDLSTLLPKHVLPFQAGDEGTNEKVKRLDAERPAENVARPGADPSPPPAAHGAAAAESRARQGTAPPPGPKVDLSATMNASDGAGERRALPFKTDGPPRTPSSPGMPALAPRSPGAPGLPADALRSSSSRIPDMSVPVATPPPAGRAPGEPKLGIAAFASITAELAEDPAGTDAIRRKYGVTEAEHQEVSRTFTHAFQKDDALRERYVTMVRQYRGYLQQAKR